MHRPSHFDKYPTLEQGSEAWLEARRGCTVTASEVGAACGIDRAKSRATLLNEKFGPPRKREPPNYFMQLGHHYEPQIADAFQDQFPGSTMETYGMNVAHFPDCPLKLGASPDRLIEFADGTTALVEIKFTTTGKYSVPIEHMAQMLAQAVCFGYDRVLYVKWGHDSVDENNNMVLRACSVQFDPALWERYVFPALHEFAMMKQRGFATNRNTDYVRQLKAAFAKYVRIAPLEL